MNQFPHFNRFSAVFHQDMAIVYSSFESAIETGLNYIGPGAHAPLLQEVEKLLLLTHAEMQDVWSKTSAEIVFFKATELEKFLEMVRDRLRA